MKHRHDGRTSNVIVLMEDPCERNRRYSFFYVILKFSCYLWVENKADHYLFVRLVIQLAHSAFQNLEPISKKTKVRFRIKDIKLSSNLSNIIGIKFRVDQCYMNMFIAALYALPLLTNIWGNFLTSLKQLERVCVNVENNYISKEANLDASL